MVTFLIILLVIACVALGLFVLVQNPKGGGLAAGSASSNMFGVQRTGDVLEKGSWVLLAAIVVLTLSITTIGKTGTQDAAGGSKIQEQLDKTPNQAPLNLGGGAGATAPAKDSTSK